MLHGQHRAELRLRGHGDGDVAVRKRRRRRRRRPVQRPGRRSPQRPRGLRLQGQRPLLRHHRSGLSRPVARRAGEGRQGVRRGTGAGRRRRADHRAGRGEHLPGPHPGLLRRDQERHGPADSGRRGRLEPQGHCRLLRVGPHRLRGQGRVAL